MAEELKYTSGYDGATTDDLLGYAQEAKELDSNANVREAKEVGVNAYVQEAKDIGVNAYVQESKELKSNEYVRSMKEQLAAEDAETVQVYDVEGVPHKISKKELISKAGIQLPSLEEIGGFVAYDTNGQVLGLMSKEQVAEVVGGLIGTLLPKKTLTPSDNMNNLEPGFYNYYQEAGFPQNFIGGSRSRGYVISCPQVTGNSVQMVYDWGYGRVLVRICNSGSNWNGWLTLSN